MTDAGPKTCYYFTSTTLLKLGFSDTHKTCSSGWARSIPAKAVRRPGSCLPISDYALD